MSTLFLFYIYLCVIFPKKIDIDKICDFDTSGRYIVADFIGNFINKIYNESIKKEILL